MIYRYSLIALSIAVFVIGCQKKDECCNTAPKAEMSAAPQASLLDTTWELATLNGTPATALEPGKMANIMLSSKDNRVGGMASINRIMGTYALEGDKLTFSRIASTRMAGPEPLMKQEHDFEQALGATKSYRISGNTLELLDAEKVLATFVKR